MGKDRRTVRRRLSNVQRGPDRRYDSKEALRAIYEPEQATDLEHQQARLYHARANVTEFKEAQLRAELIDAKTVLAYWEDIRRNVEVRLRRFTREAAQAVHGQTNLLVIEARLTEAVQEALHDLANYEPKPH